MITRLFQAAIGYGVRQLQVIPALLEILDKDPDCAVTIVVPRSEYALMWRHMFKPSQINIMSVATLLRKQNELPCTLMIIDEMGDYWSAKIKQYIKDKPYEVWLINNQPNTAEMLKWLVDNQVIVEKQNGMDTPTVYQCSSRDGAIKQRAWYSSVELAIKHAMLS